VGQKNVRAKKEIRGRKMKVERERNKDKEGRNAERNNFIYKAR
jgi:hypothetical protein